MARPKNAPTRPELEKLPLDELRRLMKDVIETERAKAKAEKLKQEADAARRRDLIGGAVLACFTGDDLKQFMAKVIPTAVTRPDDLALFEQWLKPAAAGKSSAPA